MPTELATPTEVSRHKCLIYDGDPSEQLPVVIPFLKEGLETNWRCLYIGSPEMVRMVDSALNRIGIDAAARAKSGALMLSSERTLLPDGSFDPDLMVESLSDLVEASLEDGFEGLCATGDMLWELGNTDNFDRLLRYEAQLEQAFPGKRLRGICQYRRDLVPEHAVRDALASHRSLYIGDTLNRDNLFYVPPELLLEEAAAGATKQGEWMCHQIVRILEAEQKRDEALQALRESEAQQRFLAQQLAEMNRNLERRVSERTAELEVANHHLEAFSYSVSHDLSGPLQSIYGFSELLNDEFGEALGEKGRRHLDRVQARALRMRELIEGLLALAGVAKTALRFEPVDLRAIAEDVLREIREADPNRPADIVIHADLRTSGDPALMRSALMNLLRNAWKFTSKRPRTRIEVGRLTGQGGQTVFFVQDNGVGFDGRHADKLFRAFERLHRRDEFPGTGIGLATVQRIVSRHGGRIWAEGRPDDGATFFFTLASEPSFASSPN